MNISPISICKQSFAGRQIGTYQGQPVVELDSETPDDAIVAVGNWGDNYPYPVYAWQARENIRAQQIARDEASRPREVESDADYQARKLYSTEWCM